MKACEFTSIFILKIPAKQIVRFRTSVYKLFVIPELVDEEILGIADIFMLLFREVVECLNFAKL